MGCFCHGGPNCCKNRNYNAVFPSSPDWEKIRLLDEIESLEKEIEWLKSRLEELKLQ